MFPKEWVSTVSLQLETPSLRGASFFRVIRFYVRWGLTLSLWCLLNGHSQFCQQALFHKPSYTRKQLSAFPLWCLLLSLNNVFCYVSTWKWFCTTSNILGPPSASRVSICGEVWTAVALGIWAALKQKGGWFPFTADPTSSSPLSITGLCSLTFTLLPGPFWPAPNPSGVSWCVISGLSTSCLQTLSGPVRGSSSFPLFTRSYLFLNMFWLIFLFCFSNLAPWPISMPQPRPPLITERSSKLCPYHTELSALSRQIFTVPQI